MDRYAHEYDVVMQDMIDSGLVVRVVSPSGLVYYKHNSTKCSKSV